MTSNSPWHNRFRTQWITSSMAMVLGYEIYGGNPPKIIKKLHRVLCWVDKKLWALRYRYHPQHRYNVVKTDLPPGYYETEDLILHACMSLLVRYVEYQCNGEEELQKWTDELKVDQDPNAPEGLQNSQAARQEETLNIYRWWKVQRPEDRKMEEDWMMNLFGDRPRSARSREEMQKYWDFEKANDARDQEMLHRLIEIRRSLWI